MSNPVKGEVGLTLDGRDLTLVLDHEALIEAETLYRKPLAMLMADTTLGFVGACRAMLYGALRRHHPEVTPQEAGAMFMQNMDEVSSALEAAAEAGFPKPAEGKQDSHPRKPAGTRYGRSGAKSASTRKPSGGQRHAATK